MLLKLCHRVQPRLGGDKSMQSSPLDSCDRSVAATSIDQIGKVFVAVGRDLRKCLICDSVFTRQGAGEHANVACLPESKSVRKFFGDSLFGK